MKIKTLLVLITFSFSILSCDSGKKANTEAEENTEQTIQEIDAVCIWDGGSIRSIPEGNGKYVTKMALGEQITWLGISENDTTDKGKVVQYFKVKLSDGTEGWASEYVIVTESKPGVIINEAIVYTRPNLLNATDKKFEAMDFVAIVKTEDGWSEIVGEKNNKNGWVQLETISDKKEDVAVALLAGKAYAEKDEDEQKEKIKAIVDNSAFASSVFIDRLKSEIEEVEEEIEEEIDIEVESSESGDSVSE